LRYRPNLIGCLYPQETPHLWWHMHLSDSL
jgi:hypothetical protein